MRATSTTQHGLTLIEVMVALALGLMVSLVVGTLFVQGSRAHAHDDRYGRMIENGRFALEQISRELRMIAFWGELLDPATIVTTLTAGEDCGIGLLDGDSAVLYNDNRDETIAAHFDLATGTCLALLGSVRAGTSQLALKHTAGARMTSGTSDGVVYLRSNGASGTFIDDAASTALPTGFSDWRYDPAVFYIADDDGIPHLCRAGLDGTSFASVAADDCLASGIERFHVQFGVDTNGDGVADHYLANPSLADVARAVTARVFVLARSVTPDPGYANDKTYQLGDVSIEAPGDGLHRRVFTSTVKLRNPANLATLR